MFTNTLWYKKGLWNHKPLWIPAVSSSTPITIGSSPTNRGSSFVPAYTLIDLANPTTISGTLTLVTFWFNTNATNVKVATFYNTGTNKYTCRAVSSVIPSVASASAIGVAISLACQAGDVVGMFAEAGSIERDASGGVQVDAKSGDFLTVGLETTFSSLNTNHAISVQLTGSG